ncbi:unnamed protein product [Onchocerca ochengi]|uniref:Ribosomal RNA small subunit methyltransferase I n=1 Tax=Onchocerca ochengi TaxID=42157 RepID=A0A182EW82_ONCOC|nr:unnamed protein product [Onchocerca ochengi]
MRVLSGGRTKQLKSGMYFAAIKPDGEMDGLRQEMINEIGENNTKALSIEFALQNPEDFVSKATVEQMYPWIRSAKIDGESRRRTVVTFSESTIVEIVLKEELFFFYQ